MQKPNLLILLTDQQRFDTLACYGNSAIETPNLNHFAESAVIFDEAYCVDPVCAPSRGSLLTGLWPHQHGVTNNWEQPLAPEHRALPQLLSDAGCEFDVHGYFGKWHLGYDIIERCGFNEVVTLKKRDSAPSRAPHPPSYEEYTEQLGMNLPHWELPTEHSMPGFLITRALDFIHRHRGTRWSLQVAFDQPHPPYRSCHDGTVDPDTLPLPSNFLAKPTPEQPAFLEQKIAALLEKPVEGCDLNTMEGWRDLMACYWGNMANVDFHVGRLLDAMSTAGLLENTIVVFTSDHGEMMGSHSLLHKAVMFHEATRIPLLLRLPGQTAQARINGPVSQIDLVPTLLELCGVKEVPSYLPGKSLAPLCEAGACGKHPSPGTNGAPVFLQWHASRINPVNNQACKVDARTVITADKLRYTIYADGAEELYDLKSDPDEMRNLAGNPEAMDQMEELRRKLKVWRASVGDTLSFPHLN
jgi:arylsulfatase